MGTIGITRPDEERTRYALYGSIGCAILLVSAELVRRAFAPISEDQFSFGDLFRSRLLLATAPLPTIIAFLIVGGNPRLIDRFFNSKFPRLKVFWRRSFTFVLLNGATFFVLFMFDPIGVYAFRHSKAMIPIFYVTDRKTAPGVSPGSVIFTDDPSIPEGVSYGSGEIPIRWSRGDVFRNRDSEVSLSWKSDGDALQGLSSEEFYGRVASEAIGAEHGSAILFVHGFHNQFGQAVDTAAKLAYDLKFSGPIILYSWPSGGAVSSYDHDYENADWSVRHLQEVLQKLSAIVYKQNLNLIAHSMGARVLVKAIDLLRQPYQKYPLFNNIVLAAADIKDAEFSQGSDALRNSSRRITLYVSTWDGALLASSGLHKADRVGMEPVQRPGMDVVDTRGLDTSLLDFNHGYLFDSQPVLVDLFQIVHDDKGPNSRVGIRETRDGCCWAFEHR